MNKNEKYRYFILPDYQISNVQKQSIYRIDKTGKWMYFCDGEWSYSYYLDDQVKSRIIKEITEEELALLVET